MDSYLVNVDIGTTIQLQVSASSQDEAEQIAIKQTEEIISNESEKISRTLMVLDAESSVALKSLDILDKKLIIKGD